MRRPGRFLRGAVGALADNADDLRDLVLDRKLRLAVTGLRQSGKTVFTTALAYHLLEGSRLPFLDAQQENRLIGARLAEPPDGIEPFPYRDFVGRLTAAEPEWPQATDRLTALRLELRYWPGGTLARLVRGAASLQLDVVDYPGEWLLDLPMLRQSFGEWSQACFTLAETEPRRGLIEPYRERVAALDAPHDPDLRDLGRLYADYLRACQEAGLSLNQPGRFTMPPEDADPALLAFGPLPPDHPAPPALHDALTRRFHRYLDEAVRPFYRRHFQRFDRQIVLIDLLSAMNGGRAVFDDTKAALDAILASFDYGSSSWLTRLINPRIDRVLFAVSKADHVSANQHPNLKHLMERLVEDARERARFDGATLGAQALASVRCTDSVKTEYQGQTLTCVRGRLKDERRETVLFPGEIPPEPPEADDWTADRFRFRAFAPRSIGQAASAPLRLDSALDFLLRDRLA